MWPDHFQREVPADNCIPNSKRRDVCKSHDRRRAFDEALARLTVAGEGIACHENAIDCHDTAKCLQRPAMIVISVSDKHRVEVEYALPGKRLLEERVVVSRVNENCRPFTPHEERVSLRDVEHDDLAWHEKRSNDNESNSARAGR